MKIDMNRNNHKICSASSFDTKLGQMIAIADEQALYLLEFTDRKKLESRIEGLRKKINTTIIPGCTEPIESIKTELTHYFNGTLQEFKTPIHLLGSPFQQSVWRQLQKIPYGQTISYADLAKAIGIPSAFRAVANANGANQLSLIIPCHRVINTNGALGGYSSGIFRKQWLLDQEKIYHHQMG